MTPNKVGKYTGLLVNERSGVSFMNFSLLHDHELRKKGKKKEDNIVGGMGDAGGWDTWGGVSSANCSNSLFPAPLDIHPALAKEDYNLVEFQFNNWDTYYSFVMYIPEDGTDLR